MTIENKQITIEDLSQYYANGQLVKPRLNRDLRWDFNHTKLFLEFTFKIRHILTPFLCTQTIVTNGACSKYIFSVFDGNNRMNAIFAFLAKPLKYMTSVNNALKHVLRGKPDGDKICQIIENMSYAEIMNTTSFTMLCRKHNKTSNPSQDIDMFEWFKNNEDRDGTIENAYNEIHQSVSDTKFNNVKLTLTVFSDMTDEEIVDIFQNINTSGVELTPQDILKATSSLTKYRADEITEFGNIAKYYKEYAEAQEEKEVLETGMEYTSLSGFEILFGLQLWMHRDYSNVVDVPGKGAVKMDLIFKLHKLFCENVRVKNKDRMNWLIQIFIDSVKYMHGVYNKMYGLVSSFDKLGLTLNKQFALHVWFISRSEASSAKFDGDYLSVLLYDSLCQFIKDKSDKKIFDDCNPLAYHTGGEYIIDLTGTIKETGTVETIPSSSQISRVMKYILNKNIVPCHYADRKRQYKPNKMESLLLNLYYYKHVPPHVREESMDLDHIIPISTNGWSGELDINRIGNKMMINKRVNIRKGCRNLTDAFIKENKLTYYNYPTEAEYAKIVVNGVVQQEEYNAFCQKREDAFIDYVVSIL